MATRTKLTAKTTDRLLKALLVLSRAVDETLEARAVESALGKPLSTTKVQVMRLLDQRGGQTSTQVARYLGVTKPAVSQLVDGMVRSRLLVRRPAKHDRREVRLELTKTGKSNIAAVRREQRHVVRNALRLTKARSPEAWVESLQTIAASLAKADEAFEEFCLQCGAHEDGTCVLEGGDAECLFLKHANRHARARSRARKKTTR